ncbi:MAG: branched-chain amino acid ABC transporter permease, partial [Deltaproteobacteria bacterium]
MGDLDGSRRLSRHADLPAERPLPEDAMTPPYTVTRATRASRIGGGAFALVFVALATFPLWADRGSMRDFDEFACYFLFALMWNLLAGYGGMVSIGQQAFFGIGGYALLAMGNLLHLNPFLAVPLAALVALLIALPVSFVAFRLQGGYFAIGTWV